MSHSDGTTGEGMDIVINGVEFDAVLDLCRAIVNPKVSNDDVNSMALSYWYIPSGHLINLMYSSEVTRIGLFLRVSPPSHTFGAILEKNGRVIKSVTLLNTHSWDSGRKQKYIYLMVALHLYRLVCGKQSFRSLLYCIKQVHPTAQRQFNLQDGDLGTGFCQHWNTFILHKVLVGGEDARTVFDKLHQMSAIERGTNILEWANRVANKADIRFWRFIKNDFGG